MLEPGALDTSAMGEAKTLMQLDRTDIVFAIADDRQQLPEPQCSNTVDEFPQQKLADTLSLRIRGDIDRILRKPAVGRPDAEITRIGIAQNPTILLRDEDRKALLNECLKTLHHFVHCRRLDLIGARAGQNGFRIDGGDRFNIGRLEITNDGHGRNRRIIVGRLPEWFQKNHSVYLFLSPSYLIEAEPEISKGN